MTLSLDGRIALVTGASRGIGLATARTLAREGARVVMIARGEAELRKRAKAIGGAIAMPCDVSKPDAATGVIAEVERTLGSPHILVNNAGTFMLAPIAQMEPEAFESTIQTNLIAPFRLVRALLPGMRSRGDGDIVTIGSIADRFVYPGNGAYAASKFGLRALHEALREELRGSGVRAALVSPGPVDTPLWDPHDPDSREGFTPRERMLNAQAVAEAILFVLSRPRDVNIDELRLSRA